METYLITNFKKTKKGYNLNCRSLQIIHLGYIYADHHGPIKAFLSLDKAVFTAAGEQYQTDVLEITQDVYDSLGLKPITPTPGKSKVNYGWWGVFDMSEKNYKGPGQFYDSV